VGRYFLEIFIVGIFIQIKERRVGYSLHFTPLEIMPRCSLRARGSSEPEAAAGLSDFRIIPGSAPEGGVYPV